MLDIHITEFYNDCGKIFQLLYGQFPRPISLWTQDICGPDNTDEFGMHSERYLAAYATVLWLKEEGYLRFDDVDKKDAFNHCCLTETGFQSLIGMQQTANQDARPIDHIRLAVHEQSSDLMEQAVSLVFSNKLSNGEFYCTK